MAYFVDLFSPDTYEMFMQSSRDVTGFRKNSIRAVNKVKVGDRLLCYMTKLSRWFGIFEIVSECYEDETPRFTAKDDPFVLRFKIKSIAMLEKEKAIPIRDPRLWNNLSFTKGWEVNTSGWTGKLRGSLSRLDIEDARLLENFILAQQQNGEVFPLDETDRKRITSHKIRRIDKEVTVSVPEADSDEEAITTNDKNIRESIKIQALLAEIGSKMGMNIWIPRNDRGAVIKEWKNAHSLVEILPLNYDDTTLRTIEQIDVLWLRGRSIARAFEVEHTTSIYSGILRMADLLALQPNMDIKLHIVAPLSRRDKVFQELRRPVFSLLEKGPLYENCTYLSYDHIQELAREKHLNHLSDGVLDEYAEEAD